MIVAEDSNEEILGPSDMGRKLVVALRSVTDPQALMQSIADRTALNLRNELTAKTDVVVARLEAMQKATELWHEDLVRVPTDVQKSVGAIQAFLQEFIHASIASLKGGVERELEHNRSLTEKLASVSDERFTSIATQFTLLKQATDQLDIANKTAIAAALQAQKEQAEETKRTSQTAIAKSEVTTSEAIKALTTNFNTAFGAMEVRVNDLKGRLDRGEGQSTATDPVINATLTDIMSRLASLDTARDRGEGGKTQRESSQTVQLAVLGLGLTVVWIIIAAVEIFVSRAH